MCLAVVLVPYIVSFSSKCVETFFLTEFFRCSFSKSSATKSVVNSYGLSGQPYPQSVPDTVRSPAHAKGNPTEELLIVVSRYWQALGTWNWASSRAVSCS